MKKRLILAITVAAAFSACQVEDVGEPATASQPIIGGFNVSSTQKWPFVVRLDIGGTCTGTLVAPTVILTAAHCVEGFFGGQARFGTGPGNWIEDPDNPGNDLRIRVTEAVIHRKFAGFIYQDIALLRLERPAPDIIEPVPYNKDPLDQSWVGVEVTTVGFGNNVPPTGGDPDTGTGAGIMREVTYSIDGVTAEHILVGDQNTNTCQGDSGGPTFAEIDGELRVISVTSFGTFNCQGQSNLSRTDVYQHDFLNETVAAWFGPCSQDGECNDSGDCEFIDPDCSECGFDGLLCGDECETVDLDCELGGLAGELCEDKYDCESRVCITAPDNPAVKYCSDACDSGVAGPEQCDLPLSVCGKDGDGENRCLFAGPSPGTQGFKCSSNDECLFACDTNNSICVEQCESNSDCGDDYSCKSQGGTKVCTVGGGGGGGCAAGGGDEGALLGLLLLAAVALRTRRRSA